MTGEGNAALEAGFFTRQMFRRTVLPAPLAGIGLSLAEMGDSILVGHAIGMDGLAAVGFISPLFLLASFFLFGLSTGGAVVFANFMHEGKREKALGIFNFFLRLGGIIGFGVMAAGLLFEDGLLYALGTTPADGAVYGMAKSYLFYILLGIPCEILMEILTTYLRNDDAETLSIVLQTASGVVNLIISAILLFFFDWGVAGCSFGFFASNAAMMLIALVYILRGKGMLRIQRASASFGEAYKSLRLGFATSSEYIFGAVFSFVAIHLMTDLAGTEGVAIFNIIENLSLLFVFMFEYIGKTAQPIFSTFFSECNYRELHRIFRYCLGYSLVVGGIATVATILYPEIIELLFGMDDVQNPSSAYHAVRFFCVGTIFMGVCLLLQNYFQSEEDEWGAFLVVFLRRFGLGIALAWLLSRFGLAAFWLVYPISELLTLLLIYVYKRRRGERTPIDPARVYAATFYGSTEAVAEQLDAIDVFAAKWGADDHKRFLLRLALDEISGVINERAARRSDAHVLMQLTLIAREPSDAEKSASEPPAFEIHLRDDAAEFNPFRLARGPIVDEPGQTEEPDVEALGVYFVKTRAQNVFSRHYQGFNTTMMVI